MHDPVHQEGAHRIPIDQDEFTFQPRSPLQSAQWTGRPTPPDPANSPTSVSGVAVFESRIPWREQNPKTLVIACSDGRHDEQMDEFLYDHLRLSDYDRMYLPGGPGGLSGSACEYTRADQVQRECAFLVEAHGIEEVVFVFHGAGEGGPEDAACGDYRRKHPNLSTEELNRRQEDDLAEILRATHAWLKKVRVRAFRAEVTPESRMRFVPLDVKG